MLRAHKASISRSQPKRAGHSGPRQQLSNKQKQRLRRWWGDDSFGKRKHEDAVAQVKATFDIDIKKSTLSDALSHKFSWLDDTDLTKSQATTKKNRSSLQSTLEAALLEWQIRYDKHPDSGSTTGDLLRYKATEFWNKLPEYAGKECPKWTEGWLTGFKKRHNLKEKRRHREAGSAQLDDNTVRIMKEIRAECKKYTADCVYNMDETGYYWRMKPDRSLSTFKESGRKKDKARITVNLTCNSIGTDRLPLWFIRKAKRPNCFRAERLEGLETLGAFWRYNNTAQINHQIMKEYLRWFDAQIRSCGKQALLLMDNFLAHELAVEQIEEMNLPLTNTKVMWLPLNATLIHQPLDQGIIQNWKSYVKKQFVMFMAQTFDQGKDLLIEMHVLRAIRQGISAWENDVTPATIQSCQACSQYIDFGQFPLPPSDLWTESQELVESIR